MSQRLKPEDSEIAVFSPTQIKKLFLQLRTYLNVCERVQKLQNDQNPN